MKKDAMSAIKEKINVLEPKFKEQFSKVLNTLNNSLSLLYDIATKDEKTGIYNHRFFKTIFEMELEKAKRKKDIFSFIVIDIDHFKKFNDTYGHLLGDKILRELAQTLQKEIRKYDVLARFGGEEFFILLPNTNAKKAFKIAERLRKNLWKNSQLKKYKVTVSLGVSQYKSLDNLKRVIERADKALYVSKKEGRNKTTLSA